MHVKGLTKKLLEQALKACNIVSIYDKGELPLLIETGNDLVYFSVESGGCAIKAGVPCEVIKEGSVLIDKDNLLSLKLTGKEAGFRLVKNKLEVKSGAATYKIAIAAEDEPAPEVEIPKESENAVQAEISILSAAFQSVWFKHDDSGTGDLRIVFGKEKLRVETADEYRAVIYQKPMKMWETPEITKVVLQKKTLDEVLKCFSKQDMVWLDCVKDKARFFTGTFFIEVPLNITSRLIDVGHEMSTAMKRVKRVSTFCLDAKALGELVEAASSVIKDKDKWTSAQAFLNVKGKKMELSTAGDIGSFDTQVEIEDKKGKDIRVCTLTRSMRDLSKLAGNNVGEKMRVGIWQDQMVTLQNTTGNYKSLYCFAQVIAS